MRTFYLSTSKDCHISQYEVGGETYSDLVSYGKRVAWYNHTENYVEVMGYFSPTTTRHINLFLDFYGYDKMKAIELKQIKDYTK